MLEKCLVLIYNLQKKLLFYCYSYWKIIIKTSNLKNFKYLILDKP